MTNGDLPVEIIAVAVPGLEGHGISQRPRDVCFICTRGGQVYRIVDGGEPKVIYGGKHGD